MVTLEQVEKLKERANISYDEARAALEASNGDLLEAIINLEKQNRVEAPKGGGYYSSKDAEKCGGQNGEERYKYQHQKGSSLRDLIGKFFKGFKKMVCRGNKNYFEAVRDGNIIISIPVTLLVVLLIFAFYFTLPLLVVGLFFGCRYSFKGPDLGKENLNRAMDSVADVAEKLKKEVKGEKTDGEDSNN